MALTFALARSQPVGWDEERLVSKDELLEKLWQHGDYRENFLTQSIRELLSQADELLPKPYELAEAPTLSAEEPAHAAYCESDRLLDKRGV